jgi:phosphohistidine phosphatase
MAVPRGKAEAGAWDARSMTTVVVIRHAHAGNHSAPSDHERPLDARGRREAAEAGRWLASVGQPLDVVLVSSAVRTRQTWELLSDELADAPDATIERRLYNSDLGEMLEQLEAHPTATAIAIVGHNPAVSALASALVDDGVELSPAAIAIIETDDGPDGRAGRLVASWSPGRQVNGSRNWRTR